MVDILYFFPFILPEIEPRALCRPGKHHTIELQPQPYILCKPMSKNKQKF